ncbi:TPA: HNH endonuclease [Escherichia coli]|nr:HNH endonuclease [Salmonella enterica]EBW9387881.1 HNH endonuclease [Salmonella enterica subsp. enterica serovar Mbandaka]MDE3895513.1 HNH endonuclease [Escherichia coli]OKK26789.1 DNA-binding protein [Salmonella enterica subsp. enterica serovar Typhi]HDO8464330.1 HNH endonuclease [Salmonella enterica subsp. enterica serovar Concord]
MREPRPRHTLQVIRVPSLEVQDLGLTSFDSWLDEHGYDKTNARNNRTIWAREGGWHLKRCRNLETGTDDFWFIAFDGKGGKIYPLKTQRDYRAAYRKLEAEGYAPAVIEQMTTGAAYNLAYPRSTLKQAETATSEPIRKPDVDIQGEHCERVVTQRSGVAQGKFKALLIENFAGRCAVTGWVNGGVLDAAHIEHGARYNPSNGILMTPTMHALFDADLMGIDPATLTVHFKPGIEVGELFEGRKITPLVYDLDLERLAVRWAEYQGLAQDQ